MALSQNQFQQIAIQGQHALRPPAKVISAQVDVTSAGGLVPGQPVKLVDSAGGVPKVVELAADTDVVYGFIVYDIKKPTFAAYDAVEINTGYDDVMVMTAQAAIARGAKLMVHLSGVKVKTATSGKPVVAWALDKAAADGDLIRAVIVLPSFFNEA